jgi:hypothetical protein
LIVALYLTSSATIGIAIAWLRHAQHRPFPATASAIRIRE